MFIGGLGRSGSTLLERLLGELPGVCGLGEVVHLWQWGLVDGERCGCNAFFHDCPFWQEVGERAYGGWGSFDAQALLRLKESIDRTRFVPTLARQKLRPEVRARVAEYGEIYRKLYEAVREVSGCDVLVDSSKHTSLAYCLRWCEDIDLRALHIVRDSRAVAHSWSKKVRRPDAVAGSTEGEFMARWSPAKTAVHWSAQNLGFDYLGRTGVPTMRVRYEDFVRAPADTLRAVAEFAGLGGDVALPFVGENTVELSPNHQVAGNPMRFRTGPVELRVDGAWRDGMTGARRGLVTGMTLPMLRRYGYLGDTDRD
ncbi:sulfotransferase [Actinomadura craniellae]|uniref:Sulfotransferase n=1 Tax=Actinomadura craniellae TaxID=2231787 RepID=A0A365H5Z7_9ACTN|nr:sulfotransferase [Actinomadura craniellae]RAY14507.1 sulfotransferase [Actinomadura craniellae]